MKRRMHSPQTRAILGPFLAAVEAMALAAETTISVVSRSMIADWFETHPDAAERFGVDLHMIRESRARCDRNDVAGETISEYALAFKSSAPSRVLQDLTDLRMFVRVVLDPNKQRWVLLFEGLAVAEVRRAGSGDFEGWYGSLLPRPNTMLGPRQDLVAFAVELCHSARIGLPARCLACGCGGDLHHVMPAELPRHLRAKFDRGQVGLCDAHRETELGLGSEER